MELLQIDADMDEAIGRRATLHELKQLSTSKGFRPLVEDAIGRVLEGTTSLAEVSRSVDLTPRLAKLG
jgi:type II secretory ATPase GspE/PulE/Tfp pilus assembly ATPase PilB-like protein